MTDNKDLKYTQQFKPEPNIPKTYEQFILEEQQTQPSEQDQKIADSYAAEFVAYGDVGIQKGYGPHPDIWNESDSSHKFDNGFEAWSVSTKGRAETGSRGGVYASAGADVSGFRYRDDKGDLKIGCYSASAEAGITESGASAKYKLGVDMVNLKAGGAKVNFGVDVGSEASIGEGSAKLKVGGVGVSLGKEIGINTPVGGVSINLEEAAENCTIQ